MPSKNRTGIVYNTREDLFAILEITNNILLLGKVKWLNADDNLVG